MKWKLRKDNGVWTVFFPRPSGSLHGFGFGNWKDAAEYLIGEAK